MSQADAARITGDPVIVGGKSACFTDKIVNLSERRAAKASPSLQLRPDVPMFDPMNASHLRAWEAIYDFGQAALRCQTPQSEFVR